ncbi:MAG: hypothetical protein Tp1111SUR761211_48 [Prokaryotic dsDNA virus sp.]|nr:MAG: hypothetical protein Tp1111SUR761211_48 [Prokaryotic dsDNA virus sp.]|tara:strand:- start:412 stop:810 length:399 start_codon:yes stop_codon:yes gene_type:complete
MKPDVKRILTKLSEEQQKQSLQKIEKIELARKPAVILKDAQKLDDQINKQKNKIDKVWSTYKRAWGEWQQFLEQINKKATDLRYNDLNQTMKQLEDLGVDSRQVPELERAANLLNRALNQIDGLKDLYGKPQ